MKLKLNKDHYLSIFYIVLGVIILYVTSRITSLFAVGSNDLGPRFFPRLCGIGIILCGIGKFISSGKSHSIKAFLPSKRDYLRLIGLWLVLVLYVLAVKRLGYILSSLVLMFVMTTLLSDQNKPKLWKRILFSVVMVAVTYSLFSYIIKIPLPKGTWIKALMKMF